MTQNNVSFTEENFNALPANIRACMVVISKNAKNGSTWSWINEQLARDNSVFPHLQDVTLMNYWVVGGGLLVSASHDAFFTGVNLVNPEFANYLKLSYDEAKRHGVNELEKLLKRSLKKGQGTIRMGIFSVNASPTATALDGERIPAFQLDFENLKAILTSFTQANGLRYSINVGNNIKINANSTVVSGSELAGAKMTRDNNALEVVVSLSK